VNLYLISYCVNSWEFARLFREEELYRPRFVRVRLGATDPRPSGISPAE
jgi:hypothetical protein